MTEKQKLQFEMLKKHEIFIWNIEDLTEEMKWWGCQNNCTMNSIELNEEMLIYMVRTASVAFNEEQLKNVVIPEDAWIEGIQKTTEHVIQFNKFLKIVFNYAHITSDIACEMCIVAPFYYNDERIRNCINNADNAEELKSKIIKGIFKLIEEKPRSSFYRAIHPDFSLSDEDWKTIMNNYYFSSDVFEYLLQTRKDIPVFVKQYLLGLWNSGPSICLKHFGDMSAEDLIFWCDNHEQYFKQNIRINDSRLENLLDGVKCKNMEEVLEKHGWLIKYLKSSSKKLQKASIKCNPENIQYIKKPSDEVALYVLSLNRSVEKFLKKTNAICEYLNIEKEVAFPAENYLVKIKVCLYDEDDIVKVCVVKGKDMESFLEKSIPVAFGNLSNNEKLEIKYIATYSPITNE